MCTGTSDYMAYLLRMWREDMNGVKRWRVALQDALTLEEQHFADVEALIRFLHDAYSKNDADPTDHVREPAEE
jgi:hypothetical protein